MQIGDNTEIMYFVAKTEKEMNEWLGACRHGKNKSCIMQGVTSFAWRVNLLFN